MHFLEIKYVLPSFHECPPSGGCTLSEQVHFYMNTYALAGIPAAVGYELGQPAYPSPIVDKEHELPLTSSEFSKILTNTQPTYKGQGQGGFFWELYKKIDTGMSEVDTTQVAQGICTAVLGASTARCAGVIPDVGPAPVPTPPPAPSAPTPPPAPTPASVTWDCKASGTIAPIGYTCLEHQGARGVCLASRFIFL